MRQTCIFAGSSHPQLVEAICERLGQRPSDVDLKKFSNGETSVEIRTSVRNQNVFVVQSGSSEMNDNVMELLIMIQACKGGSSKSITAVVPYFPYSRQSKKKVHRGAITARMLANLMKVAGVDHVITIDLHANQMQGFFKCPVDNLRAEPLLAKWIRLSVSDWPEAVVVCKNPGGTKRVTSLADALQLSFGIITTDRRRQYVSSSMLTSTIFEPDEIEAAYGINGISSADGEYRLASIVSTRDGTIRNDFAPQHRTVHEDPSAERPQPARESGNSYSRRPRMAQTYTESKLNHSALAESISSLHGRSTATGIGQANHDGDGYEDSEGEDEADESARDVITGRLIHGHIVDDDAPSPDRSVASLSTHGNGLGRQSSDGDEPGDGMAQSFMSTASHVRPTRQSLGGTGDATASDEEEEDALQDPEIETTVTLVGNVRRKPVIIVDDIIDKPGSWIAAAETVVKRGGATKVYCMATHGLFGGNSLQELEACDEISAIVVTDAFPIPEHKKRGITKLVVLDVSGLLAEAIRRNHHGESISQLYHHFT